MRTLMRARQKFFPFAFHLLEHKIRPFYQQYVSALLMSYSHMNNEKCSYKRRNSSALKNKATRTKSCKQQQIPLSTYTYLHIYIYYITLHYITLYCVLYCVLYYVYVVNMNSMQHTKRSPFFIHVEQRVHVLY